MLSSGRPAQDYIFRFPVKSQKQLNGLVVYNVLKADMQTMFHNFWKLPYTRAFFKSYIQYSERNCFYGLSLYQKDLFTRCFKTPVVSSQHSNITNTVSRILHHIHLCFIYEAVMRHISDKYEAIMKQISLIFSKNEVFGPAFLFTAKLL